MSSTGAGLFVGVTMRFGEHFRTIDFEFSAEVFRKQLDAIVAEAPLWIPPGNDIEHPSGLLKLGEYIHYWGDDEGEPGTNSFVTTISTVEQDPVRLEPYQAPLIEEDPLSGPDSLWIKPCLSAPKDDTAFAPPLALLQVIQRPHDDTIRLRLKFVERGSKKWVALLCSELMQLTKYEIVDHPFIRAVDEAQPDVITACKRNGPGGKMLRSIDDQDRMVEQWFAVKEKGGTTRDEFAESLSLDVSTFGRYVTNYNARHPQTRLRETE